MMYYPYRDYDFLKHCARSLYNLGYRHNDAAVYDLMKNERLNDADIATVRETMGKIESCAAMGLYWN